MLFNVLFDIIIVTCNLVRAKDMIRMILFHSYIDSIGIYIPYNTIVTAVVLNMNKTLIRTAPRMEPYCTYSQKYLGC